MHSPNGTQAFIDISIHTLSTSVLWCNHRDNGKEMGSDGMGWDEMLTDTEMPMLTQLNSTAAAAG